MMEKAKALKEVMALGFALDDALLYLDTHEQDEQALKYYQAQQAAYNAVRANYVECWGALQQNELAPGCTHIWTATPWPWEGED